MFFVIFKMYYVFIRSYTHFPVSMILSYTNRITCFASFSFDHLTDKIIMWEGFLHKAETRSV